MKTLKIGDLTFEPFISSETIHSINVRLASDISNYYTSKEIIAVIVLKGGYIFGGDLLKLVEKDIPVYFIQLSSYADTRSTGHVSMNLTSLPDLTNKHVLIIEDIVESGLSMATLLKQPQLATAGSIEICSLLFKPTELKTELFLKFVGKEIPPAFVVGYGLDYNEMGRHLPDIYQLKTDN